MEQLPSLVEYGIRRAFITFVVIICALLSVMDISITNVAFADIRGNLKVSLDEVSWVTTAYSFGCVIIIPFSSWLSGQFGRRNYFAVAVILFTVCSFFCGNATGIRELVMFRFLQGLGGGSMLVLSHTIITESWPVKKRATSQAFFILGTVTGGALAAPLGGYVTDNFSWPFIFFFNIPIGIILCVLVFTCVRNRSYERKEDWLSTIMLTAGISSLYIILERGHWFSSPLIIVLSLVGLAGITLFIRRQTSLQGLLRNVNLRIGLMLSFLVTFTVAVSSVMIVSSFGSSYLFPTMPFWINIPVIVVMITVTAILIEKGNGLKYLIAAGLLFFGIYSYMVYRTGSEEMSAVYMFWLLMIRSMAVALLSVSVSTLGLSKLDGKQVGQGAALYNIIHLLGGALTMTVFSIYTEQQTAYLFMLFIGIVFVVCIPFLLYAVKGNDQ